MDLTSDYGRVCIWEFHGGENQLFYAVPVLVPKTPDTSLIIYTIEFIL